ncbi:Protein DETOXIFICATION 44, chloroplastic [Glycine max]|nr:Protein DETOXIFICATION 44, chloroplastic [Glycine max]
MGNLPPQIPFSRFISDSEAPNLRMVSSLSTFFLCTHSLKSPTLKPLTKFHCFARLRFRVPPKASSQNKMPTLIPWKLRPSNPLPLNRLMIPLLRCFVVSVLIALPAALALAADPIASLIDTAFVGHIGAVELAAVGVSASGFNLVSKAFNVPLLNVTTSFVAEEQALIRKEEESIPSDKNGMFFNYGIKYQSKKLLPSVSTSLALAATLGIAETVVLTLGSGILMNIMGIPADSPMRGPAEQFLTLRAFGTPAIVLALAAQGTFRGFLDMKTPLYAVGKYLIAFILLWKLSDDKVLLIPSEFYGRKIFSYLKSAQQGPIPPMAGHQICMQVWLSVSLLNDAYTKN